MAFPTVRSESTGSQTSNSTTHSVALPATVQAGDLLRVAMALDGNPTVTWDNSTAGTWTLLQQSNNGSICKLVQYVKVAAGTEGGLTLSITTSASEQSVFRAVAYTDWYGSLPAGIAVATAAATGASTSPNPPALTHGWGAVDALFLEVVSVDNGNRSVTAASANYDNLFSDASNGTAGICLGSARRQLNAASDDPGAMTISASDDWVVTTVAIRPSTSTTLSPGLFSNTSTFYAPTVTRGAVTITQASRAANTEAFFAPTVSQSGGAQSLTQSALLENAGTFYAAAVTAGAVTVTQTSRAEAGGALYAPTVTVGAATLTQTATLTNASAFPAASVVPGDVGLIQTALVEAGGSLIAPVVSAGAVGLVQADSPVSASEIYAPTVDPGDVTLLQTVALGGESGTFAPVVSVGGLALVQDVRVEGGGAIYAPTVTPADVSLVQSARLENAQSFYGPVVSGASSDRQQAGHGVAIERDGRIWTFDTEAESLAWLKSPEVRPPAPVSRATAAAPRSVAVASAFRPVRVVRGTREVFAEAKAANVALSRLLASVDVPVRTDEEDEAMALLLMVHDGQI